MMTTKSSNDASDGGEQENQKLGEKKVRRSRGKVFGDRVTVTVRMHPHLFAVLNQYCQLRHISQNTYLHDIIKRDLHAQLQALGKKVPKELDELL